MNRRERLIATLNGRPVDRPAVSFYEISGFEDSLSQDDPFNIYNHPSWQPLIQLAREKSDRIAMVDVPLLDQPPDPQERLRRTETWEKGNSRFTRTTIQAGNRTLTSLARRDREVNTIWQVEHLLKDLDDLKAYVELPRADPAGRVNVNPVLELEARLGETGIVMIDTADPLCVAASLFDMATYTILAFQEPAWFHRLLEVFWRELCYKTEAVAAALPGRLWRIYGPEYASPPYLPPRLFREYAVRYDTPMVKTIQDHDGFARIHSHGHLRLILDDIASMGGSGLDPIEPPPQGDVSLAYVRERYGEQMVLFGNLEASDLENLEAHDFIRKIQQAFREGTGGSGRGFVLLPSSCPYGTVLSHRALRNFELMIEVAEGL